VDFCLANFEFVEIEFLDGVLFKLRERGGKLVALIILVKLVGVVKPIILFPFIKPLGLTKKHVTKIYGHNIIVNCINERSNAKHDRTSKDYRVVDEPTCLNRLA
jgi:hypothetical protein